MARIATIGGQTQRVGSRRRLENSYYFYPVPNFLWMTKRLAS
jgi:hypothetical protein